MIQQLNWTTLEQRRYGAKAIMMYKILNDLVQVNHSDLVYNSIVSYTWPLTQPPPCTYQIEWMYIPTPSSPPQSQIT